MKRGIVVALLQCLIVATVAGKYAWDRERLPRVWAKTAPVDPTLPIRGRYVSMRLVVDGQEVVGDWSPVRLSAAGGHLTASTETNSNLHVMRTADLQWATTEAVAFFLPEHVADPSIRTAGEELWVEVSVPKKGPPRPLRLGVRKDGVLRPLDLR